MQPQDQVTLKGTKEGFLIVLGQEGEFAGMLARIREKLASASSFFRGTGAQVDVAGRRLPRDEQAQLTEVLKEEFGLVLRNVDASLPERVRTDVDAGSRRAAAESAAAPDEPDEDRDAGQEPWMSTSAMPRRAPRADGARPQMVEDHTLFVHRNLRSGQRVSYDGSVIIIGDVNPGAEVVAGGDIIVMGSLRGLAHAGARGEAQSVVAAFFLAPTQLRIGSFIARAPDDEAAVRFRPELARVKDGALVIEPFPGWENIK